MEILQTIWTALSTPNLQLIKFLGIPFSFLEIYIQMLFFTFLLNIKYEKRQKWIYISIMYILSIIYTFVFQSEIRPIVHIILWPIIIMIIFKTSLLKSILSELLPTVVTLVMETIFIRIYSIAFGISYNDLANIPIYRESIILLEYFVIFLLYLASKHFNFNITLLNEMNKKNKIIFSINSTFGIISIISLLYLVNFFNDKLPFFVIIISTLGSLSYFLISMFSLARTTQLELTEQSLEEAQLYNKSLKILHENVRAFKHDFSNIVQSIGGYIATNDIDGLKTYYSQLLDDCQKVNNLYTLSPDVINNPAIYSLLASKYHKADELGIKINLEVFLNLNELNMKIYEFTRVLGILMDNAIEASKECKEKIINVEIRKDFSVNRQLMIISNTYNEKDVDLDKIYEKGYSSKPNNTGLGLWEVRQIMKKNNNLNLYTSKNDELFIQQLEIYL